MHNYSSTNWWHTCYPTFSKTNRNKHTKKESIKKKSSSCIVFPDNFNLTRYSCQCPNTQSQCSKNKSHFSQKTPAPHPDHVKMKISDEINDLHSANHKKTMLAKQSSAKKKLKTSNVMLEVASMLCHCKVHIPRQAFKNSMHLGLSHFYKTPERELHSLFTLPETCKKIQAPTSSQTLFWNCLSVWLKASKH